MTRETSRARPKNPANTRWRTRRIAIVLLVVIPIIAFDQIAKTVATVHLKDAPPISMGRGTLNVFYSRNTGAFGSLGANWSEGARITMFVALPTLVLAGMFVHAVRNPVITKRALFGISFVVGGGAGKFA